MLLCQRSCSAKNCSALAHTLLATNTVTDLQQHQSIVIAHKMPYLQTVPSQSQSPAQHDALCSRQPRHGLILDLYLNATRSITATTSIKNSLCLDCQISVTGIQLFA